MPFWVSPKGDFRDELTDHFVADLNGENTYFMTIPMAIIHEIAFFVSITQKLSNQFSRLQKSFAKKNVHALMISGPRRPHDFHFVIILRRRQKNMVADGKNEGKHIWLLIIFEKNK